MRISRRDLLRTVAAAPALIAGGCCTRSYPRAASLAPTPRSRGFFAVPAATRTAARTYPVIDVHAHFFNGSDVPVRGFVGDCLGHAAGPAQPLFKLLALLAERIADAAPTAVDELHRLDELESLPGMTAATIRDKAEAERSAAAQRTADVVRNSAFEREYLRMTTRGQRAARAGGTHLQAHDVMRAVDAGERPSRAPAAVAAAASQADVADGLLAFLYYMVSYRWVNLDSYRRVFTLGEDAFGFDATLGALVDFDYWLDCAPPSTHDDQVRLHQRLYEMHAPRTRDSNQRPYFYPVVAYNPWTDITQDGAALKRLVDACTRGNFVAAKIYPPIGFRPAGNAASDEGTRKRRPDRQKLDATLKRFFDTCAERRIPVLAHTSRSNGRDSVHDEFGGPDGWSRLLIQYAAAPNTPILDFGHFGGSAWTTTFAALIGGNPKMALYGDLGYWDELMCAPADSEACVGSRARLKAALRVPIGESGETVLDRTMFATDWLMLSQVKRWAEYPERLHDSLRAVLDGTGADEGVARIFGGNALNCFRLDR